MKKRGDTFIAPASIFKRVLAFITDIIIISFVIATPFRILIINLIPSNINFLELQSYLKSNLILTNQINFLFILIGIISVFYFSYFEYKIQQTPGKMLFKIYTISEDKNSNFLQYLLSNITFIPAFPFYLLWVIDPIYTLISSKNQRLMEKLTRTLVIQQYRY